MGMLYLVYPSKVHFLRLIYMESNYPSAAKICINQRRKMTEKKKIIVSKNKK